mgnify:FL=1|jgi:hypothetical protein
MNFRPTIDYPDFEKGVLDELELLFKDWHAEAKTKQFAYEYSADDMVFDGIYPYYTKQKCKILFIGREALGINGLNYIDVLYNAYKGNRIGNKHINQHKFHYLMFYIAYGANNGFPNWNEIPAASELSATFATSSGISFSFMNISKLCNESEDWKADWTLIDSFIDAFKDSKRNYYRDEIAIINPDIIITMNLEIRLAALGKVDVIEYGEDISKYNILINDKNIPLFDLFHFSAPGKSPKEKYYDIISKAISGILS